MLVGIDLSEQQRLDEAPSSDERVAIIERGAQRKRLQHVAFDVNVALQIGLGDIAFVERAKRPHRPRVAQADEKLASALPDAAFLAVGLFNRERLRDPTDAVDKGV